MHMIQLKQTSNHYLLSIPQALKDRAKKIKPRQWDPSRLVWKYPRNKYTYHLLLDEFENDVEKVDITPPESTAGKDSKKIAEKNNRIAQLQEQNTKTESRIAVLEEEIDQYMSIIAELTEQVKYLSNQNNNLEKNIRKTAKVCIGNKDVFSSTIDTIDFDNFLPIELQKRIELILKDKTEYNNEQIPFIDLIHLSDEQNLLSNDAKHLLHIIRRQRNLFAHDAVEPRTRLMRVIFVIAAFSLLSDEFN